jgi:hypothetical protein
MATTAAATASAAGAFRPLLQGAPSPVMQPAGNATPRLHQQPYTRATQPAAGPSSIASKLELLAQHLKMSTLSCRVELYVSRELWLGLDRCVGPPLAKSN